MTDEINADNQSVAVGGDVIDSTIFVGYTQADYEKGLRDREKVLRYEYAALLALADNRTEVQIEKRVSVEKELSVVGEKLANIEASYSDIRASLDEALKTNSKLEGLVPAIQLEAAEKAIELGPEAAYEAYNTIVASASDPIAKAAFQAAELAKSAIYYPEALKHYRKAAVLDDQNSVYLNALASMLLGLGYYSEAESLFLESLEIRKKQLGDEHPYVATSLSNLGVVHHTQGHHNEAESWFLKAMKVWEKLHNSEHSDRASTLNNLASLYESQDRYMEAEKLYRESLDVMKKWPNNEHVNIASTLNNLAGLCQSQRRYSEAELLYIESFEIRKKKLADGHPEIAASLNNLAELYREQRDYDRAEPLYLEALYIIKKQLGDEHPNIAASLNNIALLYTEQGRYSEAEPLILKAIQIIEKCFGVEHPSTKTMKENYHIFRVQMNNQTDE